MSGLAPFALGLCAQQTLLNRTWAAANVLYEPTSPVEPVTPTIAIYCGRGYGEVSGRDILNADADAVLRFEMFAPASVAASGVTLSADAAPSLVYALLWRQIEAALLTDVTPFAALYRRFVLRMKAIDVARGLLETEKGQKLAVAVVELRLETLADPPVGAAASGVWEDFLVALNAAGGELATLSGLLAAQIQASPAALPDWQVDMSLLGATAREVESIGLGPLAVTTPATDLDDGAPAQEIATELVTPLPDL